MRKRELRVENDTPATTEISKACSRTPPPGPSARMRNDLRRCLRMTQNPESNVYAKRIVFACWVWYAKEWRAASPPNWEDGVASGRTNVVASGPLRDTPCWPRDAPPKIKYRNSRERFGFDDEDPLMCIVLLGIKSDTYPA